MNRFKYPLAAGGPGICIDDEMVNSRELLGSLEITAASAACASRGRWEAGIGEGQIEHKSNVQQ